MSDSTAALLRRRQTLVEEALPVRAEILLGRAAFERLGQHQAGLLESLADGGDGERPCPLRRGGALQALVVFVVPWGYAVVRVYFHPNVQIDMAVAQVTAELQPTQGRARRARRALGALRLVVAALVSRLAEASVRLAEASARRAE